MLSSDEVLQQCSRNVPADARDSTRDFAGRDRLYASDRYHSRWMNAPVFAFTRNSLSLTSVAKLRATKRCDAAARDRQRSAISTISRRSKRQRLLNRSPRRTVSFCQQHARETENGLDFYHVTERRRIPDMAKANDNRLHPWDVFMQL
ncbi:hypothetical protein ALC57_13255 [Trachymyrmex cornetzi]|uniref:Uncharacterized protein n=1 Tax=Trachymyrmex cornetzi TaxID=471704 RepID=A0A151IZQ7_9HYME|nr:hypothetical protein ALC57_13255 [Trachymyrmex cornetzi]